LEIAGGEIRVDVGVARPILIERNDLHMFRDFCAGFGSRHNQGGQIRHKVVIQGQVQGFRSPEKKIQIGETV